MVKHRFKKIVAGALVAAASLACGRGPETTPGDNAAGESPEAKGERIVAEYVKRDAAPFRKMRVRFTIDAEGDPQKVYEVDSWRKQTPEGTTTLSQIVRPAEDADLGSLTVEPKGQKPTVISYIASRDEFRETDTSKMFFGGLTGAELLGEWNKYTFRAVGEKDVAEQKVVEVEGKLKPGETTIFARLNALFRIDNFMLVELRSFDNNNREIRTWRITDIKGEPDRPYAARTEVENPVFQAKITIEILSREFPPTIDEVVFTRERLKQIARK